MDRGEGHREAIGIAGAGRVAQALGRALTQAGLEIAAVASRSRTSAERAAAFAGAASRGCELADLSRYANRLILAVPDRALEEVSAAIASRAGGSGIALHTCGARGAEALAPLAAKGFHCGSLHPLQTIPTAGSAAALRGIAYAVDGDQEAVAWAEDLAGRLEGFVLRIRPDARPLYHAAAVMASNYVTVLLGGASQMLAAAGVAPDLALRALGPLARTAIENTLREGPAAALTGPIERGDAATVERHLAALAGQPAVLAQLYRAAGRAAVTLARSRSSGLEQARALDALLSERPTFDE